MLSRNKKARAGARPGTDASAADNRESGGDHATAAAATTSPDLAAGAALPLSGQQPETGSRASRRGLKNWRVRSRLLVLIIVPTVTAVVLGAISIVTSVQGFLAYQKVEQLAGLSQSVTHLAGYLGQERLATVQYIADGTSNGRGGPKSAQAADLAAIQTPRQLAAPWIKKLRRQVAGLGSGYPVQVQNDARNILSLLGQLPVLRQQATTSNLPVLAVVNSYSNLIDQLLAIDGNIALGSGDQQLGTDVTALSLVSRIREEASVQAALLIDAYRLGSFPPNVLSALTAAQAQETADVSEFDVSATQAQLALYRSVVSGSQVDNANGYEQTAIELGKNNKSLVPVPFTATEVAAAFGLAGVDGDLQVVQQRLVSDTIGRASGLRQDAIIGASAVGGGVLLVLLLALLLTTIIGRSMVGPLRRLRSGALEVAGIRLPEAVRTMGDSDGAGVPLEVQPIDVDSADEIGEVARAFDQVHREALRLAANEAALRGNVNAMFVNLSRRSQSLVERQIRLIDDLEQGEQDPDRLANLFQMDHLATRMRRNSENLLVLAGHDASRRWNQPVALVDVLRAAVSEIEQYERVTLNVQPGIAVRGHAVNDVVHLLAELAENATSFSSAETPVAVAGHLLSSGGVLLDITDQGVGMGAEEMAHANWRLDNPPVVDVAVSRRMGLFVVARLAARHGIRVRLRPAPTGGLTALVWLPEEVISHQADAGAPVAGAGESEVALAGLGAESASVSATRQEIDAAREPRFASLRADAAEGQAQDAAGEPAETAGQANQAQDAAGEPAEAAGQADQEQPDSIAATAGNGKLGPRRIPGAGPRPGIGGDPAATGPLPAFRSSPQPARQEAGSSPDGEPDAEPEVAAHGAVTKQDADLMAAPAVAQSDRGTSPLAGLRGRSERRILGRGADVVVPPAEHVAAQNRLPIFEAVESDWFRRGRSGLGGWPGPQQAEISRPAAAPEVAWATPSDRGWAAAAAASSPATGGTTVAGLPKRVPQANLVPGAASGEAAEPVPAPARSAAATRDRFASFQRGVREGRAAATGEENQQDGDDSSGSG